MSKDAGLAVLNLVDVEKSFGANRVLNKVSFDLHAGSITALLGANGAGKSTLIKVLAGLHEKSGGQILIEGTHVSITNPREAATAGIQIVHQRVSDSIVPGLSVAENLCFEEIVSGELSPWTSAAMITARARQILTTLQLEWDEQFLASDAGELGIADGQLLLLARALIHQPKVLVLDEPTSTLSHSEVERLFEKITTLRDQGVAILYVSHRMGEIRRLADRVVVLRDGAIVHRASAPFDLTKAIDAMVGTGDGTATHHHVEIQRGQDITLSLNDIQVLPRSAPFSLNIRGGEVTGILGLIGSGKTELASCLYGLGSPLSGHMTYQGKPWAPTHPAQAVRAGMFLVPEDRVAQAMLPEWSIKETVTLPFLRAVSGAIGVMERLKEKAMARAVIDRFAVVTEGVDQPVDALSGGNQQKVIVGRWLINNPQVFLLDEPFRGVDIGARHDISRQLRELAGAGATVIVLSSDVDEIIEVSDRILVLVDGCVRLDGYNQDIDYPQIVSTMSEATS